MHRDYMNSIVSYLILNLAIVDLTGYLDIAMSVCPVATQFSHHFSPSKLLQRFFTQLDHNVLWLYLVPKCYLLDCKFRRTRSILIHCCIPKA